MKPNYKENINKLQTRGNFSEEYQDNNRITVSYTPNKTGVFKINFHAPVISMEQVTMGIEALEAAEEEDQVVISLQSCGGNVDVSGGFIHAMEKCACPIHIVASGGVHSAGTHILLQADSFELSRNFNSLIHNGSSGSFGNLNEYHAKSDFDKTFLYEYYKEIYSGFLSDKEFDEMMLGKNIWLDAQSWMERSEKRNDWFKEQVEKFEKAAQKALKPPKKPRKPKANGSIPPPQYEPSEVAFKGLETGFDMTEEELMFLEKSVNTKK
jgi:ATP-dependent protease ClpP protease subunit